MWLCPRCAAQVDDHLSICPACLPSEPADRPSVIARLAAPATAFYVGFAGFCLVRAFMAWTTPGGMQAIAANCLSELVGCVVCGGLLGVFCVGGYEAVRLVWRAGAVGKPTVARPAQAESTPHPLLESRRIDVDKGLLTFP